MLTPAILVFALTTSTEPFTTPHAHPESDSEFLKGTCPEGDILVVASHLRNEQVRWDDALRIARTMAALTGKPVIFAVKLTRLDIGRSIILPAHITAHRAHLIFNPDGERKYTVTRLDGAVEHYAFMLSPAGDYVVGAVDGRGNEAPLGEV